MGLMGSSAATPSDRELPFTMAASPPNNDSPINPSGIAASIYRN